MEDFGQELLYSSEFNAKLSKECNLGLNYYYGTNGYNQDHSSAYSIFKNLGDAGDKDACVQLGCMYFLGHAVDLNYKQALHWWGQAEEHDEALYGMGMIYHTGSEKENISKDPKKAQEYWERASDMFNEAATAALFKYYRNQTNSTSVTHVHNHTNVKNEKYDSNIKKNTNTIKDIKFECEMLTQKIEKYTTRITVLESNVSDLSDMVKTLVGHVASAKASASSSESLLDAIKLRLDEIVKKQSEVVPVQAANSSSQLDLSPDIAYVDEDDKVQLPSIKRQRERRKPRVSPARRARGKLQKKKNLKNYMQMMMKVKKRQAKKGSQKSEREELIDVFKTFDRDGDGTITADEFRKGMMTLGHHLSKQQVKDLISEVDEDGNDEIDYEEFVEMMLMQDEESLPTM